MGEGPDSVPAGSVQRLADVKTLVLERMPRYQVDRVVQLREGCDHVAYEVNGELIVRFSKETDPARRAGAVEGEARLLDAVAGISPLPVPRPIFTVGERGCLAYFKVPGLPLLDVSQRRRLAHGPSIGATLGEFLTALQAAPAGVMADLVGTDVQPPAQWLREAAETYQVVAEEVPVVACPSVEAFLETPPPDEPHKLVFSRNDLGIEHVLVDPGDWSVTGVIDWSDAALVDPAYDLGLIHRDLGSAALDAALGSYQRNTVALRQRAVFYARCSVFDDLAHGIQTGQKRYIDKSLAAMEWLFP